MSVLYQPFSSNMSTSVRAHMKFAKTHIKELSLFSQTHEMNRHAIGACTRDIFKAFTKAVFEYILTYHAICTASLPLVSFMSQLVH